MSSVDLIYENIPSKHKDKLLIVKDDKIDILINENRELTLVVNKQSAKIDKLLAKTKDIKNTLGDVQCDLDDTRLDFKSTYQKLDNQLYETNSMLSIALNQRVPPELDLNKAGCFVLIKLKTPIVYSEEEFFYYVVRGQTVNTQKITKHKGVPILVLDCNPNPGNLYTRIKESLSYIKFRYNCINLTSNDEKQLINDITKINDNKYVVEVPKATKKQLLYNKTLPELRNICRDFNYRPYSKYKTKDDLINFIITNGF